MPRSSKSSSPSFKRSGALRTELEDAAKVTGRGGAGETLEVFLAAEFLTSGRGGGWDIKARRAAFTFLMAGLGGGLGGRAGGPLFAKAVGVAAGASSSTGAVFTGGDGTILPEVGGEGTGTALGNVGEGILGSALGIVLGEAGVGAANGIDNEGEE